MPTYAYSCRGCKRDTFEIRQSIMADPLRNCGLCEKPLLYRKPSTGGSVVFKGNGFYCTDYPKPKPPK